MTGRDNDETKLLTRARNGDADAFAALCETHRRRVWRVVSTVTRNNNGSEAEDLAQEAIVRAWTAFPKYRGEAAFETWLCRIALNAAHDHQRSAWKRRVWLFSGRPENKGAEPLALPGEIAPGPHEDAERRESQRRIRAAVAQLKEPERVPIWLIYFEEFSLADVARVEGIAESTIRSRVKAGLKRLERVLNDLNPDDLNAFEERSETPQAPQSAAPSSARIAAWKECTT